MNARAPVGACLLIFAGFAGAGSSGDFSRRISASDGPHVVANGATTAFSGQVAGHYVSMAGSGGYPAAFDRFSAEQARPALAASACLRISCGGEVLSGAGPAAGWLLVEDSEGGS